MNESLLECIKCKSTVTESQLERATDEEVWGMGEGDDHSDCGCMEEVYPNDYKACHCKFKDKVI